MTYGILFAAGKGSRLAPITDTIPKPLVSINGTTLLERNMQSISELVDEYIIVISYLGQMIIDQIGETYQGKPVQYVWQENPKGGTFDALRNGVTAMQEGQHHYLVMNSDDIHGVKLFDLLHDHIDTTSESPAIGTHVYSDKSRLSQFGIIQTKSDGTFEAIIEKPQEYVSDMVNIGVYYFPASTRPLIYPRPEGQESEEYITDFVNLVNKQMPIQVLASSGQWLPVSYPEDIEKVEGLLAE